MTQLKVITYGNVDLGSRRVEDQDFAGRMGIVEVPASLGVVEDGWVTIFFLGNALSP